MTCKDFESVVADLARDVDAAEPEALAHAVACGACAARLDAERSLSADLRALARSASAKAAPPTLEARLVAALREAREAAPAPAVVPFRRRTVAALATAAAIAAVAVGTLALRTPEGRAPVAPAKPLESARVAPRPLPPAPPAPPVTSEREIPDVLRTTGRGAGPVRTSTTPRPQPAPRPALADAPVEIATEFYPLVSASGPAPVEGGQVVRMELPRAQLAALGFQMNVERVDDPITADVLLGHDGVARAIRFIQTSSAASER